MRIKKIGPQIKISFNDKDGYIRDSRENKMMIHTLY